MGKYFTFFTYPDNLPIECMKNKIIVLPNLHVKRSLLIVGSVSILFLLFLISLSGLLSTRIFGDVGKLNATKFFTSRILYWICLLLLWLYAVKIEKQKLLIWPEKKYQVSTYLSSGFLIFAVLFAGGFIISIILSLAGFNKNSEQMSEIITILSGNKLLLFFTVITAGVVEELIFRGYLMPRFEIIFKNPYWAIAISSLLFGLLHYKYGTVLNVVGPVFIGFVFGYYYWRYRNIKVIIVCHILWDLVAISVSIVSRSHALHNHVQATFF
ncbi:MAG: type II CAAX endopeptidase family protein [Ginsengibacter sp.]